MRIQSIKEKQQKQAIYFTYKLENVDCLVEFELFSQKANFQQFSQSYLLLETPFKYFDIEYQKDGFIKISEFYYMLRKAKQHPIEGAANDVINQLFTQFESIEEDLGQRLIHLFKLSNNPEFVDEKLIKENDKVLMNKIRNIDQSISDNYKQRNQNWQLLYIVETTVKIIWNGEERKIIKLGKTIKSIENYVLDLKKQYQGKILFKPLFAQRLYTPQKKLVDKIFFHNKLLKSIPESKIYIKAEENDSQKIHYEFYLLTDEFVTNFEKFLTKFIQENINEYQNIQEFNTNSQNIDIDNNPIKVQISDQIEDPLQTQEFKQQLQQQSQYQKQQSQQQEQEQQQEQLQETQQIYQKETPNEVEEKKQEQDSLNQILLQVNETDEQSEQIQNDRSEMSNTFDEPSLRFFDQEPSENPKFFGVPLNYQLSEANEEIVYDALQMMSNDNPLLKALLFVAAAKKQMKNEQ